MKTCCQEISHHLCHIYIDNFIGDFYTNKYNNELLLPLFKNEADQYLSSNSMAGIIKEILMYTFVGNMTVSLIVLFTNYQSHILSVIHRGGSKQLIIFCNSLM